MLVSERGVLAGCSDQIRTVVFAKLYSFFLINQSASADSVIFENKIFE